MVNKLPGLSLLRRLKAAVPERNEHVNAFQELTGSLPKESLTEWKASVEAWEQDGTKKNPFEFRGPGNISVFGHARL